MHAQPASLRGGADACGGLEGSRNADLHAIIHMHMRELPHACRLNNTLPTYVAVPTREEVQMMVAETDIDKNGHVDFHEFLELAK